MGKKDYGLNLSPIPIIASLGSNIPLRCRSSGCPPPITMWQVYYYVKKLLVEDNF
jgi:hypothetical protein